MAEERISVVLSTDLKNSVIVKGETWDEIEQLMPKARELYASLVAEFGIKTYGNTKGQAGAGVKTAAAGSDARGPVIACADCGEPIKGKKDQKTGNFQSATEVAGWGQKKYGRALCLANVNGCYAKAGAGSSSPTPARRAPRQQPADELEF